MPESSSLLPGELLELAEKLEIDSERVEGFETTGQLKNRARGIGLSASQCNELGESVHGLLIQVDEIRGGPDYRILIRHPLPPEAFLPTLDRIASHLKFRCKCTEEMAQQTLTRLGPKNPKTLAAFVLLHEIAHRRLDHMGTNSTDEIAADLWALDQLRNLGWI